MYTVGEIEKINKSFVKYLGWDETTRKCGDLIHQCWIKPKGVYIFGKNEESVLGIHELHFENDWNWVFLIIDKLHKNNVNIDIHKNYTSLIDFGNVDNLINIEYNKSKSMLENTVKLIMMYLEK